MWQHADAVHSLLIYFFRSLSKYLSINQIFKLFSCLQTCTSVKRNSHQTLTDTCCDHMVLSSRCFAHLLRCRCSFQTASLASPVLFFFFPGQQLKAVSAAAAVFCSRLLNKLRRADRGDKKNEARYCSGFHALPHVRSHPKVSLMIPSALKTACAVPGYKSACLATHCRPDK